MERQRATESAKASAIARRTLGAHKRRLSDLDCSRSQKKARSQRRSEISKQSTEGSSEHRTVIESRTTSPTTGSVENQPEQSDTAWTTEGNSNLSLVCSSDKVNGLADGQFPYLAIAQFPAHGAVMGTGVLELADPAVFPLGDQQSAAQNVTALTGASKDLATTTDESAAAAHSQMFPSLDSAMVTEALSFGRYTMDGSAIDLPGLQASSNSTCSHLGASRMYYPDNQHSENDSAPTQASSFVSHTMDGSPTHKADQVFTQDLQCWVYQGYSA